MNAQEAIEIIQSEVNINKTDYSIRHNAGVFKAPWQIERQKVIKKHEEALSIVLESARLFHEHTVPNLIRDNVRFGRSEEYTTVYGVPLEKVGIELEKEQLIDDLRKKDKSDNHEADIQHIGETAYRFGRAEGYYEGVEAVKELFRK